MKSEERSAWRSWFRARPPGRCRGEWWRDRAQCGAPPVWRSKRRDHRSAMTTAEGRCPCAWERLGAPGSVLAVPLLLGAPGSLCAGSSRARAPGREPAGARCRAARGRYGARDRSADFCSERRSSSPSVGNALLAAVSARSLGAPVRARAPGSLGAWVRLCAGSSRAPVRARAPGSLGAPGSLCAGSSRAPVCACAPGSLGAPGDPVESAPAGARATGSNACSTNTCSPENPLRFLRVLSGDYGREVAPATTHRREGSLDAP